MSAVVQLRTSSRVGADVSALNLIELARSKAPEDRHRLLIGVIGLCEAAPPATPLPAALGEIFLTLATQAAHEIRQQLAERLAGADWAPVALIEMLALDEIDIAAPVIAPPALCSRTPP